MGKTSYFRYQGGLIAAFSLILIAAVGAGYIHFRSFQQNSHLVTHTYEVLANIESLTTSLNAAETAQRSYMLTRGPVYAASYQAAKRTSYLNFERISRLTRDNRAQVEYCAEIKPLLDELFSKSDEAIGKGTAFHEGNLQEIDNILDEIKSIAGGMRVEENWLLMLHKNSLEKASRVRLSAFLAISGTSLLFIGIISYMLLREVKRREKIEAALRESEHHFRSLFANAKDYAVYMIDLTGRVVSWPPAAQQMTGYQDKDVVGKPYELFFPPDVVAKGHPQEMLRQAAEEGRYEEEAERLRKDGSRYFAQVVINAIHDEEGRLNGYVKFVRDITEKHMAEEKLRKAQEQIQQLQRIEAIGRLAGGVAHDFNNLLTGILGYANDLRSALDGQNELRADIDEIIKAAERASSLTRQLLAFGRRQVAAPKVINLNDMLRDAEKLLRPLIPENISLDMQLAPDTGNIKMDPSQIEQVLINLTLNARDATIARGGKLTVTTRNCELVEEMADHQEGLKAGSYVILSVSDTGIGMTPEIRERIFEPYFTTKETGKGSGLGLATIYGIVKQNGGDIFVYSHLNMGTTFKVYLPRTGEAEIHPQASLDTDVYKGRESILLIEDEDLVRDLTRRTLEHQGYRVVSAASGEETEKILPHAGHIDLLLTDVVLPGMNGAEIARLLSERQPDIKVLFMSGYSENVIVDGGILKPGVSLLEKPFTPQELTRKIRSILDGSS
jgi:PAS domain S-box-containing protein